MTNEMTGDRMLTTVQAAERLGIKPRSVVQLIRRGKLVATRFGRDLAISEAEVERYRVQRLPAHRPPINRPAAEAPQLTAKETTAMRRTFRCEHIPLHRLTATDLREIAAGAAADAEAYRITIDGADEPAQALYLHSEDRIGIAWGADATWADVWGGAGVEGAIETWLNDPDEWAARN